MQHENDDEEVIRGCATYVFTLRVRREIFLFCFGISKDDEFFLEGIFFREGLVQGHQRRRDVGQ